jgi:hypothetical protein
MPSASLCALLYSCLQWAQLLQVVRLCLFGQSGQGAAVTPLSPSYEGLHFFQLLTELACLGSYCCRRNNGHPMRIVQMALSQHENFSVMKGLESRQPCRMTCVVQTSVTHENMRCVTDFKCKVKNWAITISPSSGIDLTTFSPSLGQSFSTH